MCQVLASLRFASSFARQNYLMPTQKRLQPVSDIDPRPRKRRKHSGREHIHSQATPEEIRTTIWDHRPSIRPSESRTGKRVKPGGTRRVFVLRREPTPEPEVVESLDIQEPAQIETVTDEDPDAAFWETLECEAAAMAHLAPKRKRKQRNDSVSRFKSLL